MSELEDLVTRLTGAVQKHGDTADQMLGELLRTADLVRTLAFQARHDDDPAAAAGRALAERLTQLAFLAPAPDESRIPDADTADPPPLLREPVSAADQAAYQLRELVGRFHQQQRQWLPAATPPEEPATLWVWAHLMALRVGEADRVQWLAELRNVAIDGIDGIDFLIPSAAVFGVQPVERPNEPSAEMTAMLDAHREDSAAWHLGTLASIVLLLAQHDFGLHTALLPEHRGWVEVTDELRSSYREAFKQQIPTRPTDVPGAQDDWYIRVDEAVRSLAPDPFPAPDSWWQTTIVDGCDDGIRKYVPSAVIPSGSYPPKQLNQNLVDESEDVPVTSDQHSRVLWVLRTAYLANNPYAKVGRVVHGVKR
ncbi:hypothetical protein ACQEVZ_27605 [Dactylosporangium sp. CA-152071]|uniref:hypothetical protein n=1 Tax=Dactylosporangium sp. CA-152071 TaxID=3239933 RepID=UPI003D8CD715